MLRLGLCCLFHAEPQIKFRTTTVKYLTKLEEENHDNRMKYLDDIVVHNSLMLKKAIVYCRDHNIGCFRVSSQIWPCYTHSGVGYHIDDLESSKTIRDILEWCRIFSHSSGVRLAMHPDQFVVLNSQKEAVVASSIAELEYQCHVAELCGIDVVNIHAGGAYGDKPSALLALGQGIGRLSARVRSRLTLENDDKTYTPEDLLPFCLQHSIPLVYDVHHHRVTAIKNSGRQPSDDEIKAVTMQAIATWNGKQPLLHISSPKLGWEGDGTNCHHDMIDIADFPLCWFNLGIDWTLEVEAKHKEVAVADLRARLLAGNVALWTPLDVGIGEVAAIANGETASQSKPAKTASKVKPKAKPTHNETSSQSKPAKTASKVKQKPKPRHAKTSLESKPAETVIKVEPKAEPPHSETSSQSKPSKTASKVKPKPKPRHAETSFESKTAETVIKVEPKTEPPHSEKSSQSKPSKTVSKVKPKPKPRHAKTSLESKPAETVIKVEPKAEPPHSETSLQCKPTKTVSTVKPKPRSRRAETSLQSQPAKTVIKVEPNAKPRHSETSSESKPAKIARKVEPKPKPRRMTKTSDLKAIESDAPSNTVPKCLLRLF